MDWTAIEATRAFAERWHDGQWTVDRLPELLKARVVLRDVDPILLGATRPEGAGRLIYLHERLAGPGYIGVLAHECAHPFQGATGLELCSGPHGSSPREMTANVDASILAVPLAMIRDVSWDDGSAAATAQALCVPTQMVRVRHSVAVVLGELPGRREYALDRLSAACIGLAAYFWRLSNELAASDLYGRYAGLPPAP